MYFVFWNYLAWHLFWLLLKKLGNFFQIIWSPCAKVTSISSLINALAYSIKVEKRIIASAQGVRSAILELKSEGFAAIKKSLFLLHCAHGAKTLSVKIFSITTLSRTIFSVMALSIMGVSKLINK
jgi:hypothetical protein